MIYENDKGSHGVYNIQFHSVACVKYRRKVLTGKISVRLKEIDLAVAKECGIRIIEQETNHDHMHMLFASKPQIQISKVINSLIYSSQVFFYLS